MGHSSTLSYCFYVLAPHHVREEPGSSLPIQLKSPTSQKSCPSPTSGIRREGTPEWEGPCGTHVSAPILFPMSFLPMSDVLTGLVCVVAIFPCCTIGVLLHPNPNSWFCLPHPRFQCNENANRSPIVFLPKT